MTSPEKMKEMARDYTRRHKTDPFGSTWILSGTLLFIASEVFERWDKKEQKHDS